MKIIFPGHDKHFWDIISKWVFKGQPIQWVPFHTGFFKGQVKQLLLAVSKWVLIGQA